MKIIYNYKHVDKSEAFETLAEKKISRMSRMLNKDAVIDMFIKKEPKKFVVTTNIDNLGKFLTATADSYNLYKSLDLSIKKVKVQVQKNKQDSKHSAKNKNMDKASDDDLISVEEHLHNRKNVNPEKEKMINKKYGKDDKEEEFEFSA